MSGDGGGRAHGDARQAIVGDAFVDLVDTLVSGFDVIDVLTGLTGRCVDLLGASAAAILLADSDGCLRVLGASSDDVRLLELFELQNEQGPGLDCYKSGKIVADANLSASSAWPRFATHCLAAGFPSVCAVPMRLEHSILGCLSLFMSEPIPLSEPDIILGRALADVASIALVQDLANRDAAVLAVQLKGALTRRAVIEQAKGMVAEHNHVDMHDAFEGLRAYARNRNLNLTAVAEDVVAGKISTSILKRRPPPPPSAQRVPR